MEQIASYLNYKKEDRGKISQRAELIKFFVDNLKDREGKKYEARRIAVKLSHLEMRDLYFLRSECQDIINRRGVKAMNKWFWWSIKSK